MKRELTRERGIANILITAVALPVIALLAAVALDFIRIPLTKNIAHSALSQILSITLPYDCSVGMDETGSTSPGPMAQVHLGGGGGSGTGGMSQAGETCATWITKEAYIPAAHNFCFLTESDVGFHSEFGSGTGGGCKPITNGYNLVDPVKAGAFAKIFSDAVYRNLTNSVSSWPYNVKPSDIYVEIAYAKTDYALDGGMGAIACPLDGAEGIGSSGSDALLQVDSSQLLLRLSTSGTDDVCSKLSPMASNNLGWKVERCSGDIQSGECERLWLPSYWVVAAINIRLHSYLGGLAWPSEVGDEDYYIVKDWIIFPHLNVAGIEKSKLTDNGTHS